MINKLQSMTGYSQGRAAGDRWQYDIEMRSVNHRFLDVTVRLPKSLSVLEFEIRSFISGILKRGKVDVSLAKKPLATVASQSCFDAAAFEGYLSAYRKVMDAHGIPFEDVKQESILDILRRGDVFPGIEENAEIDTERKVVLGLVEETAQSLIRMRREEGQSLERDLRERLSVLRNLHREVKALAGQMAEKFRERIYSKVKRIEPEVVVDEARLASELVLYCDRADITEELIRLESHFELFENALSEEGQGKKLDFIVQEFLREFNTIASKAQDASVQSLVVEAKTGIEKMKEQIQNIE